MTTALDGLTVGPDATITDLGSVKGPVLRALGERWGGRFVGGHPMCGTERSGHTAVDPGLFTGARWAVCLEEDTELPRWLRVAEVALAVGAEVVPVTAAEHDDAVAAISHVPHLLAAALAEAAADAGPLALALAAGSFASGTRVIGSDPAFVTAMVEANAGPTADGARPRAGPPGEPVAGAGRGRARRRHAGDRPARRPGAAGARGAAGRGAGRWRRSPGGSRRSWRAGCRRSV